MADENSSGYFLSLPIGVKLLCIKSYAFLIDGRSEFTDKLIGSTKCQDGFRSITWVRLPPAAQLQQRSPVLAGRRSRIDLSNEGRGAVAG